MHMRQHTWMYRACICFAHPETHKSLVTRDNLTRAHILKLIAHQRTIACTSRIVCHTKPDDICCFTTLLRVGCIFNSTLPCFEFLLSIAAHQHLSPPPLPMMTPGGLSMTGVGAAASTIATMPGAHGYAPILPNRLLSHAPLARPASSNLLPVEPNEIKVTHGVLFCFFYFGLSSTRTRTRTQTEWSVPGKKRKH